MDKVVSINASHPLVGRWKAADEFSSVTILITANKNEFYVSACDESDGENAEIYEPGWDGNTLTFGVHWNSNGRFIKYRFTLISEDAIDVSFTYSGQETWLRQKPNNGTQAEPK